MATVISLVSLKGGTGRTALAAHLAAVFAEQHRRCLVIDLDPLNGLGHWFGMHPDERTGFARRALTRDEVMAHVRRERGDVAYLPFGQTSEDELVQLEVEMMRERDWVRARVNHLAGPDHDVVLLDAPSGHGEWLRQVVRASDLVLGVLVPDPASYTTLPALRDMLERHAPQHNGARRSWLLLNRLDPREELQRDVRDALTRALPDALLPTAVPYDAALPEALARGETLVQHAPDSQVLAALRQVAEQLLESRPSRVHAVELAP